MDDKLILQELKAIKRALTCENTSSGVISDPCCPITNTLLDDIKTAIETLDISVDNLVLNTDTLEINTDELKTLLTTLNNITQIENDESQVLLTDVKTNLQTIINKLNQPCGGDTIKVDICNIADSPVDTYANDTFQITDCELGDIGTPQEVKKTVVLNKLTTQICNAQELADLQNSINVLNSQVEIQNNAITLLTIRMDDCSCPTGSALDVSFSDARLNLCTQNTTTGKFIVYLTFAGSGTDLDSVEGVTLITVNVPDAVNPTLSVTPTTIPDSSPTAKSFNLLSGMKAELVTGGSGGTITFTVKFIDTSTIVHYANITFTIPDFDTSGDNCDNELTPSSVTFDDI